MDNRKKFNHLDYESGQYAMHFRNTDEIRQFYEYLDSCGLTWGSGDSYLEYKHIPPEAGIKTFGLNFIAGRYGQISSYKDSGYTILEFSDFDWNNTIEITLHYSDLMGIA